MNNKDIFYRYSNKLDELKTKEEKIGWFEGRVNKILMEPIEQLRKIWRKDDTEIWRLNLGLMNLICNAILAISNFYLQKGTEAKKFKKFVKNYMSKKFMEKDPDGKEYVSLLWDDFRCGLTHGFTILHGGIVETTRYYLNYDSIRGLGIDFWSFFDDFKQAFNNYLKDIKEEKEDSFLENNFLTRFNQLFGKK